MFIKSRSFVCTSQSRDWKCTPVFCLCDLASKLYKLLMNFIYISECFLSTCISSQSQSVLVFFVVATYRQLLSVLVAQTPSWREIQRSSIHSRFSPHPISFNANLCISGCMKRCLCKIHVSQCAKVHILDAIPCTKCLLMC